MGEKCSLNTAVTRSCIFQNFLRHFIFTVHFIGNILLMAEILQHEWLLCLNKCCDLFLAVVVLFVIVSTN